MTANTPHAIPLPPAAGVACGLTAAVGYAAANAALKASTETDAILVAAVKSIPTIAACAPLLALMWWRGRPLATSWKQLPLLVLGVSIGQLFGNLSFQISLGIVGLALAVPLNLGAMIMAGALFGWWILGEPVSRRTIAAILILIVAASVLSLGGHASTLGQGANTTSYAGGVLLALLSGVAYAMFGTTMRKSLREGLTVPLAMMISGVLGMSLLSPIAIQQMGWREIGDTSAAQWTAMALAGSFNMGAFFLLSLSLRAIPVVAVNLLNATQAALAALAGVWWFSEPLTGSLMAGCGLTVLGLVVLGTGGGRPKSLRSNHELSTRGSTSSNHSGRRLGRLGDSLDDDRGGDALRGGSAPERGARDGGRPGVGRHGIPGPSHGPNA